MSFDFKISEGDLKIGSDGDLQKVENTEKLIQDILKVCITPLGSNILYPWYGSQVSKTLIGNIFDMEFMSSMASAQLTNSLETLRNLQQEQAKAQRVTPFEQLAAVREVLVQRNQVDPRFFSVRIRALTKALSDVTTGFDVSPTTVGL